MRRRVSVRRRSGERRRFSVSGMAQQPSSKWTTGMVICTTPLCCWMDSSCWMWTSRRGSVWVGLHSSKTRESSRSKAIILMVRLFPEQLYIVQCFHQSEGAQENTTDRAVSSLTQDASTTCASRAAARHCRRQSTARPGVRQAPSRVWSETV